MARHLAPGELTAAARAAPGADATKFTLAQPADEADVRALLRSSIMPGAVRVAFTREPDYFLGEGLGGATDFTCVQRASGVIASMGRLSLHTLHRNGAVRRIGYLGELRIRPDHSRAVRRLRDGYALLHEQFRTAGADGCFTSIAIDNARARRVLEHGRRIGLPAYLPIAELVTLLVPVGRARAESADPPATAHRDELTAFLEERARGAQLTLTWDDARWAALARHGIGVDDFAVVREHGNIVAAGAVWDQRAFRQTLICGYGAALSLARPVVNLFAAAGLAARLPSPGDVLPQGAVLGASAVEARYWMRLWPLLRSAARRRGLDWLVMSRDAQDPDVPALRRAVGGRVYRTQLYEVRWPETAAWSEPWDDRPFRPEVAFL